MRGSLCRQSNMGNRWHPQCAAALPGKGINGTHGIPLNVRHRLLLPSVELERPHPGTHSVERL
eukprot:4439917-Pleurochrysis_carterae.AAC.2